MYAVPRGSIGTQAEYVRVLLADGTLMATRTQPTPPEQIPPICWPLPTSSAPGGSPPSPPRPARGGRPSQSSETAVGLLAVLAAKHLGAQRITAMSRHPDRQALARRFGATDIVTERGDDGVAKIIELTEGLGAHSVIEPVGTQESMMQAIRSTRPGGHVGYVASPTKSNSPGMELFFSGVHLHGGPAPVRRFLPELIELIINGRIDPGEVFDLTLPLEQAAEATKRWMSAA